MPWPWASRRTGRPPRWPGRARSTGSRPAQTPDSDVVLGFAHRISSAVYRARERMDRLEELDLASQDLLIEVVRVLEKQLWMFRAQG